MSDSVTLKFKTVDRGRGSAIETLQVEALIEVNGVPYRPGDILDDLRDGVAYLTGRVDVLENMIRPTVKE